MITVSIIAMLAVVAIPGFSSYEARSELNDKVEEINSLISQMGVVVRNPEKDIDYYRVRAINNQTIALEQSTNNTTWTTVKSVPLLSDQSFETLPTVTCTVDGEECVSASSDPTNFVTLTDNNFSPNKKVRFKLQYKPLHSTSETL